MCIIPALTACLDLFYLKPETIKALWFCHIMDDSKWFDRTMQRFGSILYQHCIYLYNSKPQWSKINGIGSVVHYPNF